MAPNEPNYQAQFANFLVEESHKGEVHLQKVRDDFDKKARKAIKADGVRVIAACGDQQKSVANLKADIGLFTKAILELLKENQEKKLTWVDLCAQTKLKVEKEGSQQVPQLTSSRDIDLEEEMYITPPQSKGKRIALLIGINYEGESNELQCCHNDTRAMKEYLINYEGFKEEDMTILMDDGVHKNPTKKNINAALKQIARSGEPGDSFFFYFSGHGGSIVDRSGDEIVDGMDETLVPSDAQKLYSKTFGRKAWKERAAYIVDDDILKMLVRPLKPGVTLTCLIDCCHSGTVLDLPYRFTGTGVAMERNYDIPFHRLAFGIGIGAGCVGLISVVAWRVKILLENSEE